MKASIKPAIITIFMVLIKAATAQDAQWAIREGGTGSDQNFTVGVDLNKQVYTGIINDNTTSTTFNGQCTITGGSGAYDAAYCKLDSNANCLVSEYFATYYTEIRDMHVDDSANVYLTGYFYDTKTFCTSLTPYGVYDIFVSKYTSAGVCEWTVKAGSTGSDYGLGINIDSSGNVYVTGVFQGTGTFGTINLTASGTEDGFIAKYNSSGVIQWAERFGGPRTGTALWDDESGWAISNVANGIFYLTGCVDTAATFGSLSPTVRDTASLFLAKMDTSGNFWWVKVVENRSHFSYGNSVIQDKWNNVFLAGDIDTGATLGSYTYTNSGGGEFIAKFDSSGSLKWLTPMGQFNSTSVSQPKIVLYDSAVWFGGIIGATSTIGQNTYNTNGLDDILVSRLDYNGKPLWVKTYGGSDEDEAYGVAVDASGIAYVTGPFGSTINFTGSNLSPSGTSDAFVLKIASALPITSVANNNEVCEESAFNVSFLVNTTYNSGNVFTLQLSDTSGYFGSAVNLGTLTGTTAGTISGTVSNSITPNSNYRIRIIASNPADTGEEYPQNININAQVSATASSNSPVCVGQTLTLTGGANSLTSYAWSGPSSYSSSTQSPTVSDSATLAIAGTYTITVTNSYGCTATVSTSITFDSALQLSVSNNSGYYCTLGNLGAIELSVTTGSGPFTYTWSNSATTQDISGLAAGIYKVTVSGAAGCVDSIADTLTCIPYCGIDSLDAHCTKIMPLPGIDIDYWSFSFNYSGSNHSTLLVTPMHSILQDILISTVDSGFNRNLVLAAAFDWDGYTYDTLLISVVDSATGDICGLPVQVYMANDSGYYFTNCDSTNTSVSFNQVQCVQNNTNTGLPDYMATFTINNSWGGIIHANMINCPNCSYNYEADGGIMNTGSNNDTIYFEPDSTNQDSVTFYYTTTDTAFCPLCQIPFTISIPNLGTLAFTSGDSFLCAGSSSCYAANAANSQSVNYFISSGGATINDTTGCVSNVTGSFTVMAIAQGVFTCTVDTAYFSVGVDSLQISTSNYFYCALDSLGTIQLSMTGGTSPFTFAWSDADSIQSITGLAAGNYKVTVSDALGCVDSLADSLTCVAACGIDSLKGLCTKMMPFKGYNIAYWSLSYNYTGSSGSTLFIIPTHSSLYTTTTSTVDSGFNRILVTASTIDSLGYSYDTLLVIVIDSATGNTCNLPLQVYSANDSSYYFTNCDTADNVVSYNAMQCIQNDSYTGLPYYMATFTINNTWSGSVETSMINCPNCSSSTEVEGGIITSGSNGDTIYFEPDSTNQDSVTFIYVTTDTAFCPLCQMPFTIAIPQHGTLAFTAGDTFLCGGGSSCYTASAANGQSVNYFITTGGATINDTTGCVSNVISSFTVMAIAQGVLACAIDTAYLSVAVDSALQLSVANNFYCIVDTFGAINLSLTGGTSAFTYAWGVGQIAQHE